MVSPNTTAKSRESLGLFGIDCQDFIDFCHANNLRCPNQFSPSYDKFARSLCPYRNVLLNCTVVKNHLVLTGLKPLRKEV